MPQDPQYRQINGPDGPINFPSNMSDEQVTQAMRKLYPPKQAAPIENRGPAYDDPTNSTLARVGSFVPQWATGPLEAAKKYAVDPFDRMAAKGAEVGGKVLPKVAYWGGLGVPAALLADTQEGQGAIKGVGEVAGSTVADPRNWPLLGSSAARPALQKLIARGFGAMMSKGAYDAASNLYQNWDKMTPSQRSETATQGGLSALFAVAGFFHTPEGRPAGPQDIDKGAQLKEKFGKEAQQVEPTTKTPTQPGAVDPVVRVQQMVNKTNVERARVEQAKAEELPVQASTPKPRDQVAELGGTPVAPELERVSPPPKPEPPKPTPRGPDNPFGPFSEPKLVQPELMEAAKKGVSTEELAQRIEQRRIQEVMGTFRARRDIELQGLKEENRALKSETLPTPPESTVPNRLEAKQTEMQARQAQAEEIRKIVQGYKDRRAAEAAKLSQDPETLRKQNEELRAQLAKAPERSEVGRVSTSGPPVVPSLEPIQTPEPTTRRRESVRPAEVAEVSSEPRSLRGDLGERPQAPPVPKGQPDWKARMEVFRQRVDAYMKKNPGVAKTQAQQNVAEQMRKELGAFGGGGADDIRARREEKINNWVNQLRDPKTEPAALDVAFKQLVAYGLSHNDIIARVKGEVAPEPSSQQRGSFIDRMIDQTQGLRPKEEGREGEADIPGVKGADQEELERIFNLKDERGFWTMWPAKKAKPTAVSSGTAIDDLTHKIEATLKAVPPNDSRMKIAERLDKTVTEGWDEVQKSLGRISAQAATLRDNYLRPPEQTDYHSSIGRFSGSLNRSAWELRQFTKNIKEKLPDERQREAVTNWLQAAGDDNTLAQRAARSKGSVRAGYERARNLTQEEIGYAKMIEAHFDRRLKEAIQLGVLDHGLENYVPQVWKPGDQTAASTYFSNISRSGLLKPDFNAAKKRIFESYFEGEQAGFKPVSKDIGFLVASWERAFNQAVASRNLMFDLSKGTASDGRPILAPSGRGKALYDSGTQTPLATEPPSAYLIYPKASEEETGDFRAINHPALTKWNWVGKDDNGAPMFMKGDLRVHPEFAKKLDNVVNRGKWAAEHPIQTAILKGQGFFKATLLSMSPFHQIQEGTHGIFHTVNPFGPPMINLADPSLGKLLDRGLVIGNYDPIAAFDEGLTSAGGGAIGKIPGLGRFQQKYSDYLFGDYIPRLKARMATEAYERNLKRYSGAIAQGKITTDQLAEVTANQANAAFGELNYIMMGRNPQTQAIMRMMFLAPDFLEARGRFVGQALAPYGREQQVALVRGALGMYVTARVLNKLLDDDYHWDRPFSLVVKGYEYQMRSLPGDIWHLMHDENSFVMHRLNPVLVKSGMEFATGKDEFGRKRSTGEQVMDAVRGLVPIPSQSFFKAGAEGTFTDRLLQGVVASAGISTKKYRTKAAAMAHQYAVGSNPNDITGHHITELVQDITEGRFQSDKIRKLILEGKMNPRDVQTAIKLARMPELYRDYYRLPVELKVKIWNAATPDERALLRVYAHGEPDVTRLLPEQRAEFMNELANQ